MRTKTSITQELARSEAGLASILITMIMVVVISLIVLGFAQIALREQRQSLDNQLSTQAFYAAESGVNDVINAINNPNFTPDALDSSNCNQIVTDNATLSPDGNPAHHVFNPVLSRAVDTNTSSKPIVQYTCLLVDENPPILKYNNLSDSSKVIPITTEESINEIDLVWTPAPGNPGNFAACPNAPTATPSFPKSGNWNCPYGIARIELVPTAGSFNRSGLATSDMTIYAVPVNGGSGLANYNTFKGGNATPNYPVVSANCNANTCTERITNLSDPGHSERQYYMDVRYLYQTTNLLTVQALNNSDPNPLNISLSQILIDSTGEANDVLRRMQVTVPYTNNDNAPPFAIETGDELCKLLEYPVTTPPNPVVPFENASTDYACNLNP